MKNLLLTVCLGLLGCGGRVEAEASGWYCSAVTYSPALPDAAGPVCVCSDLDSKDSLSYAWELSAGACVPPGGDAVVAEPASAWECHVADVWDTTPGEWCVCSLPCDGRFPSCGARGDQLTLNPNCEPPEPSP